MNNQPMTLAEIEKASGQHHLVHELFSLKRCFGSQSKIGIVVGSGCETDRCGSVAELVEKGHINPGLEWLDPFLLGIPSVNHILSDDHIVFPFLQGVEDPRDVARREQEEARKRRDFRRQIILEKIDAENAVLLRASQWYTCH